MALTGSDRGTGTHNTSATTFTGAPASNLTAGAMAVMCIAADNANTSGTAFSTFTVTDTKSNTWTRRTSPLYDPGAASAGVEGAIFTTPQNGGALTTGDTITVTFNAATTAKAWTLMEVVASLGTPMFVCSGVNTGAGTGTPTVTTGSITNGDMVIGAGHAESPDSWAGDADSSNGTWSTHQHTGVGTTTSAISITSQRKVVTGTATQTYNPTRTSSDCILSWIQVIEGGLVNLLTFTEQFDNGVWAKSRVSISADATTDPNATATAEKVVEDGSLGSHEVNLFPTSITNVVYTGSIYVKAAERTQALIRLYDAGTDSNHGPFVNLTTGGIDSIQTSGATWTAQSVTDAGNGWWRVSATMANSGTQVGLYVQLSVASSASYTGDGSSGIYIWGAQLERGELSAYKPDPPYGPFSLYNPWLLRAPILAQ